MNTAFTLGTIKHFSPEGGITAIVPWLFLLKDGG